MKTISSFAKFSKSHFRPSLDKTIKNAVVYTRVSSKEQYDKNLSLESQKNIIGDYAMRNGFSVSAHFGGTYESAKTDGRKEFQRMLDYVKKGQGKITHILVYMLDRFSRTGGGAIKLAEDLRDNYGVDIIAVTQPADTSNAGGILQQSIQFIFSKYDNDLRRQRATTGMKEKLSKGKWIGRTPIGYDTLKSNGETKVIVNDVGKKLKKAFLWKSEGMQNEEIVERLKKMGVTVYKQHLSRIFKNPFYCGLMAHRMLEGKIVEGTHEQLISQEIFLKVNKIHEAAGGYGIPHQKERLAVPLKVFAYCGECDQPFTGYVVKQKQLWYYKCRTKGCRCNKSAKEFHQMFIDLLEQYTLKTTETDLLLEEIKLIYNEANKENRKKELEHQRRLNDIEHKIENLEEGYYLEKNMSQEKFEKFYHKLNHEREEILKNLPDPSTSISNFSQTIEKALLISLELPTVWASADIKQKEKLQKLLFPEGIIYDRKNEAFRTKRVNSIFHLISSLQSISDGLKTEQAIISDGLSRLAEGEGFEPPDL